ncbi:MAG TPA: hypothetical protein PLL64_09145 [Rhodothermales bacterium]|nr:hypothetical protein [Rhodothermales bacterium]HRR10052.1 hypothetical protein [Rhodothermales bacterium]
MYHPENPSAATEPFNRHALQDVNPPISLHNDSVMASLVTVTELYCHNHDPSPY